VDAAAGHGGPAADTGPGRDPTVPYLAAGGRDDSPAGWLVVLVARNCSGCKSTSAVPLTAGRLGLPRCLTSGERPHGQPTLEAYALHSGPTHASGHFTARARAADDGSLWHDLDDVTVRVVALPARAPLPQSDRMNCVMLLFRVPGAAGAPRP